MLHELEHPCPPTIISETRLNVRFWHKAEITALLIHVRFGGTADIGEPYPRTSRLRRRRRGRASTNQPNSCRLYSTFLKWGRGDNSGQISGRRGPVRGIFISIGHTRKRDSSRAADVGCHAPPRGVRMPRSFSWAAIARTLANPCDSQVIHDGPQVRRTLLNLRTWGRARCRPLRGGGYP
jgi:hypothetical protein